MTKLFCDVHMIRLLISRWYSHHYTNFPTGFMVSSWIWNQSNWSL